MEEKEGLIIIIIWATQASYQAIPQSNLQHALKVQTLVLPQNVGQISV